MGLSIHDEIKDTLQQITFYIHSHNKKLSLIDIDPIFIRASDHILLNAFKLLYSLKNQRHTDYSTSNLCNVVKNVLITKTNRDYENTLSSDEDE